jgi:protein-L-isoaspartate O-methyltransferase
MARFLQMLDVQNRNTVLEIGTGTGYNAALLSERLGDENVASIDIDPACVESARTALASCGYEPTLAVADGEHGYPQKGPYDRIVATCSVHRVPHPWIDQLRMGGVMVAPFRGRADGALVALRPQDDGSLQGRLHREGAGFMALRSDADSYPEEALAQFSGVDYAERPLMRERSLPPAARFYCGLAIAGFLYSNRNGHQSVVGRGDGAWSSVKDHVVTQAGPRRMWDLFEAALDEWTALGEPDMARYGMTITSDRRQLMWLDSPDSGHRWEL